MLVEYDYENGFFKGVTTDVSNVLLLYAGSTFLSFSSFGHGSHICLYVRADALRAGVRRLVALLSPLYGLCFCARVCVPVWMRGWVNTCTMLRRPVRVE